MANSTVANILTDVHYDLKLGSSDQTSRQAELISYINRVLRTGVLPTLIRYESDYGLTEWTTTETTGNVRQYSLPTGFVAFNALYCIDDELTGTATGGSTTTVVIDEDDSPSDEDDTYNGYMVRGMTGDAADLQSYIYDYDGDTLTATLSPAVATAFAEDDTVVIFKPPEESDELKLKSLRGLLGEYNTTCSKPEAYAIDRQTYVVLGGIPDSSSMVLYGLYWSIPTKLTATTDSMPYDPIFDEVVRSAVTQIAMNRDEYSTEVEVGIMSGDRDCWDKGYGVDAVGALLDYIFRRTNLKRIHLKTLDLNIRAQKCFQKCGFTLCGRLVRDGFSFVLMEIHRKQWE